MKYRQWRLSPLAQPMVNVSQVVSTNRRVLGFGFCIPSASSTLARSKTTVAPAAHHRPHRKDTSCTVVHECGMVSPRPTAILNVLMV